MSGVFGMNIKMAIYGESHGKSIGVVLDGLKRRLLPKWRVVLPDRMR